jgi:hypothetical protein
MIGDSAPSDVFRFVQLRPRRTVGEARSIALSNDTRLAKSLIGAQSTGQRIELANAAIKERASSLENEVSLGAKILEATRRLSENESATTADLEQEVPELREMRNAPDSKRLLSELSDVLLASYFATRGAPTSLNALQATYRAHFLPSPASPPILLKEFIRRPLLATAVAQTADSKARTDGSRSRAPDDAVDERAALNSAIEDLLGLDRPDFLAASEDNGLKPGNAQPFALSPAGVKMLSKNTATLLKARGVDPRSSPVDVVVMSLFRKKLSLPLKGVKWPRPEISLQAGVTLPPAPGPATVSPAGVADLIVVKQHIKSYEGAELAHLENVLIGEKKSRAHRQLERSEETYLTETEETGVRETELQTADRFELNQETAKTIRNDQKIGFDLSLSGRYGPTVDFKSSASLDSSTFKEESAKNSTRFAKDIIARSLERITTRVREMRTRTIIRETEETNLHELKNETQQHFSGVYQFLDKVYEMQLYDYGIRAMFDFMIPEPASFLWWVEQNPNTDLNLPEAPNDLRLVCPDASALTEDLALELAAEYGADIDSPPLPYQVLTVAFNHGQDDANEEGQPRSVQTTEITVPAGYQPKRARIHGVAVSDEKPVVAVTVGWTGPHVWKGEESSQSVPVSGGCRIISSRGVDMDLTDLSFAMPDGSKLPVLLVAYETRTYAFDVNVVVQRTEELMNDWRLKTFEKLRAKYEDRVREYEQKVEQLKADAQAKAERENRLPFGAPPSLNQRTIATELKKHCISVLTQQWYDAFDSTKDGEPPTFDLLDAAAEGSYIRFFEHSFEWDQAQWVFYPYFWARKTTWVDRFLKQEIDPEFLEFLHAGSARVVVPVRPGFELAVTHFLETGKLWGGEGEPPQINSPMYVSIVDEIRERSGAPKGETPIGEPWETRVPTGLVLVRPNSDLPRWKRVSPIDWQWHPEEA